MPKSKELLELIKQHEAKKMIEWVAVEDVLDIRSGPYDCDISAMDVDEKSPTTSLNHGGFCERANL